MNIQAVESKLFNFLVYYKYMELKIQSRYSGKRMEALQARKVKKLVESAVKHELYREKFRIAGIDPASVQGPKDLEKLPALTKQEYRDMISKELENDKTGKYRYCHKDHTSGSTGIPLHTCLTPSEYATVVAQLLYILDKNGYRLFRDSSLDMSSPVHKGTRQAKSLLQKIGLLQKHYVSTMSPQQTIIDAINQYKPTEILAGKSILHSVLQYASEHNIDLYPVKMIVNTAEPMDDNSAALIEKFFGPKALIDSYATIEAGIIAHTDRGNRHKFCLNPVHYLYTIRDEKGAPADNGELLITNLYLQQFPMINYKQGDAVESMRDDEGRMYLTKVKGRNDDHIVSKDGKKYSFHYLFAFLPKCAFLEQYRVIQESYDHLHLLLAPRKDAAIDKSAIEKEFTERLDTYLNETDMSYTFEWVDEIPIDQNGKIRVLISKVK